MTRRRSVRGGQPAFSSAARPASHGPPAWETALNGEATMHVRSLVRPTIIGLAILSVASTPRVQAAGPPQAGEAQAIRDEVSRLRQEFDALRGQYDQRLAALEARLAAIETRTPGPAPAPEPATTTPPPETPP